MLENNLRNNTLIDNISGNLLRAGRHQGVISPQKAVLDAQKSSLANNFMQTQDTRMKATMDAEALAAAQKLKVDAILMANMPDAQKLAALKGIGATEAADVFTNGRMKQAVEARAVVKAGQDKIKFENSITDRNIRIGKEGEALNKDLSPEIRHYLAVNSIKSSPMNLAAAQQSLDDNKVIEAKEKRAQDMFDQGFASDGTLSDNGDMLAQGIADYTVKPLTGMALRSPYGLAIMAEVKRINPAWDQTTAEAKSKAAKDFATGPQGNSLRSFSTASVHLGQTVDLMKALKNRDVQGVNFIKNKMKEWAGSVDPTNFDAVKAVVSQEVNKSIVPGVTGVEERRHLAELLSSTKGEKQLLDIAEQYLHLMEAQRYNLTAQRKAAGLPESTLPEYKTEYQSVTPGTEEDGYRFNGGAPGEMSNWEKI